MLAMLAAKECVLTCGSRQASLIELAATCSTPSGDARHRTWLRAEECLSQPCASGTHTSTIPDMGTTILWDKMVLHGKRLILYRTRNP